MYSNSDIGTPIGVDFATLFVSTVLDCMVILYLQHINWHTYFTIFSKGLAACCNVSNSFLHYRNIVKLVINNNATTENTSHYTLAVCTFPL
jgi:hypothetical protein